MSITFIEDLIKDASENQKKEFLEAQYKTIVDLSKKNERLNEEVNHLKDLISSSNKLSVSDTSPLLITLDEPSEVTISKVELRRLKEASFNGDLTLEQTKKVEIYAKILNQFNKEPKSFNTDAELLTDGELLRLVNGETKT